MTFSALRLLSQIRKAQRSEGGWAWIDDEAHTITTVVEDTLFGKSKRNTIDLASKWDSIDSIVDYLQSEGFLECNQSTGHLRLNHKGYHYFQEVVISFLWKSIAVPIVVAFVTTLLTLWVQGLFPPK